MLSHLKIFHSELIFWNKIQRLNKNEIEKEKEKKENQTRFEFVDEEEKGMSVKMKWAEQHKEKTTHKHEKNIVNRRQVRFVCDQSRIGKKVRLELE